MQLYFIRHAQSGNNLLYQETQSSHGRSEDPELTDLGRQQAERLAQFLQQPKPSPTWDGRDAQNVAGFGITHLYTSLMVRAVETGYAVAQALGLPLVAWRDLHEEGGIYMDDGQGNRLGRPGKSRSFFAENYPRLVLPDGLDDGGWWNRPYEADEERPERAARLVKELLAQHGRTDDRVAVISHGGFYNHFIAAVLRMPRKTGLWYALNNVALTRIDFFPDWVDLVYHNRLDYLPREMIT
jgi:2,3-bisphosphoglycerate-dependent phosphoglycerate mutase